VFIVFTFDPGWMARDRPGPDRDRLLIARIAGIARRHAPWREPTEPEIAAASAELREVAGDRADLLAEEAGILLGFHEGGLDEPRAKAAAQLLIAAGADESLIPGWIEEGRRRAEAARLPPFSQPGRSPRRRLRTGSPPALRPATATLIGHRKSPAGQVPAYRLAESAAISSPASVRLAPDGTTWPEAGAGVRQRPGRAPSISAPVASSLGRHCGRRCSSDGRQSGRRDVRCHPWPAGQR
jgi:hypothetical protein